MSEQGEPTLAELAEIHADEVRHFALVSVAQSLQAVLTAELADNAGWEMLINLARELGQDDMADEFEVALSNEEERLLKVRSWGSDEIMSKAV